MWLEVTRLDGSVSTVLRLLVETGTLVGRPSLSKSSMCASSGSACGGRVDARSDAYLVSSSRRVAVSASSWPLRDMVAYISSDACVTSRWLTEYSSVETA